AGILHGPNGLGFVNDPQYVEGLAEVGVILLLFTIGIEFSLSRLKEMGREILVGRFSQMGFTILATLAAGSAFLGSWRVALFLGFLIALSSTAIVLKVMTDAGEIDAPHGRLATGVLIFQDLCVVPIMLVLPFLAGKSQGGIAGLALALGKAALVVVGVIIAAWTIVPRALAAILKTRSRELVLIAVGGRRARVAGLLGPGRAPRGRGGVPDRRVFVCSGEGRTRERPAPGPAVPAVPRGRRHHDARDALPLTRGTGCPRRPGEARS